MAWVAIVAVALAIGGWWFFPKMPDVRGMTRQQAQHELEDAGFQVSFALFPPSHVIPCQGARMTGSVVGQDPCPGPWSRARRGSTVTVWITTPVTNCNPPPGSHCA